MSQIEKKEENKEEETKINRMCRVLGRYYQSKNKPYNKLFSTFCDDNGIDDDALPDELEAGAVDSILIDFDDNFPYSGDDKSEFIYNKIKNCFENPNVTFAVDIPKFNKQFFEITQTQYDETSIFYQTQCPKIYNCGLEQDSAFLTLLVVGRKNNFDYAQHLVDDYFRYKVKHANHVPYNILDEWIANHPHFKQLKEIKCQVLGKSTPYELAKNAVSSFGKRCCPQLILKPLRVINDSLETIIRYIESVTEFIANLFNEANHNKTMRALCPFQIDLCIATDKPKKVREPVKVVESNDENDDDDDETKDNNINNNNSELENDQWVDCVGDIQKKLKANKLQYKTEQVAPGRPQLQVFTKLFNAMEVNQNANNKNEYNFYYLHRKRVIGFVDRRIISRKHDEKQNDQESDPVYVYTAPIHCAEIPRDVCGLWYISSSRTCLLPDVKYGTGANALKQEAQTTQTAEKLKQANIATGFHCRAGLLTISFHVKSRDEVKMYLYFNGQIIRFMPQDVKTVLPLLFNMEYGDNKKFIENKHEIDPIVNNIRKVIKDVYFQAFQQSYD